MLPRPGNRLASICCKTKRALSLLRSDYRKQQDVQSRAVQREKQPPILVILWRAPHPAKTSVVAVVLIAVSHKQWPCQRQRQPCTAAVVARRADPQALDSIRQLACGYGYWMFEDA